MASKATIAGVLAYMHELYPTREIGTATAEAWAMAFADWDDADLQACARQAATTPGRTFFPTPGEIAAFRPASTVDSPKILRQIERLGVNLPGAGYVAPQVDAVRAALGDVIADAYATAGAGSRVFSDDETTRAIAYREFHKSATAYAAMPAVERPALVAGPPRKLIPRNAAAESITDIVKRLPSPTSVSA